MVGLRRDGLQQVLEEVLVLGGREAGGGASFDRHLDTHQPS